MFEVTVTESAPIAGVSLQEAKQDGILPEGVLIVAIDRDDTTREYGPAANRSGYNLL